MSNAIIVTQDNHASRWIGYIKNHLTGTIIPFVCMPKGLSESLSASFAQQAIVGASIPRIVYSSTSAKTISLTLENLNASYLPEGFSSLIQYVRAFQALVYPTYSANIVNSPNLTLVLGDRSMSCVCTSVNVAWRRIIKK